MTPEERREEEDIKQFHQMASHMIAILEEMYPGFGFVVIRAKNIGPGVIKTNLTTQMSVNSSIDVLNANLKHLKNNAGPDVNAKDN